MPEHFPTPHPAEVAGLRPSEWERAGRPVPSVEEVQAYQDDRDETWSRERAEAWRAEVETLKAAHVPSDRGGTSPVGVPTAPPPSEAAADGATLRLPSRLDERLMRYASARGADKESVAAGILDDHLAEQGF